ncbi:UNVERIFIED_CONTAM: hypothetical protein Cloal_3114 [Acetivibrio alkalicellulosi]
MPDLINIRLTKDSPAVEAMDEAASKLGMSRNEMILKAIGMMASFDKVFYKKPEVYSKKMKVPMWTALQNMTIKRWAQDASKAAVWGSNTEVLIEFSTTDAGTISPKELLEMAYQMAFDAEAKERIAVLEKEVATGILLRNEDSFEYWESEMTDSEALEKFKGGRGDYKK